MVSPWAARAELPGFACKPGSRQEADASRSGIKPIPVARQAAQRIAGFGKYERSPHSALRASHAGYKPTPVARQAAQRIAGSGIGKIEPCSTAQESLPNCDRLNSLSANITYRPTTVWQIIDPADVRTADPALCQIGPPTLQSGRCARAKRATQQPELLEQLKRQATSSSCP